MANVSIQHEMRVYDNFEPCLYWDIVEPLYQQHTSITIDCGDGHYLSHSAIYGITIQIYTL